MQGGAGGMRGGMGGMRGGAGMAGMPGMGGMAGMRGGGMGGMRGGGMRGGGGMGGGGGAIWSPGAMQLADLVNKVDQLTNNSLTVELTDDQKKAIREQLKGLGKSEKALDKDEAQKKLKAMLNVLGDYRPVLTAVGFDWPGEGSAARFGLPSSFFKVGKNNDHLTALKKTVGAADDTRGPDKDGGAAEPENPDRVLASLITKLDLLTSKALVVKLTDKDKKALAKELKGIDPNKPLAGQSAGEKRTALLKILEDAKLREKLESLGFGWTGYGAIGPTTPPPNPFNDPKAHKHLDSLKKYVGGKESV
jgi:hypothetical protein